MLALAATCLLLIGIYAEAAVGQPRARTAATTLMGGINVTGVAALPLSEADAAIAEAHAMHARVVRTEVPWEAMEPNAPEELEPRALAFADRLLSDAAADGIRVIMMVDNAPCWAASAPAAVMSTCRPGLPNQQAYAWPPTDPASFAAFTAFLAHRYGSELAALEVWNEPDQSNEKYLAGPHKAARYATLLRAAYPAIKQADPSVQVLGGSFVGSNGAFLRALYAEGIKGYYDGLSVHFYTLTIAALRAIREVQRSYGDSKPLWLAEFGWSSCWPHRHIEQEQGCVPARTQALNLTNSLREMARMGYVAAATVYKLKDSIGEEFGVFSSRGARKRSFAGIAAALANPLGRISRVTLRLRVSHGAVVASGSGPVGDFMGLEVFQGATLRYTAQFTLNRFNEYRLRLPSALGTSGLRVRAYQYFSGPPRATQSTI
jgi:hypothetical protein